jgi:cellulose synthase/poly-beta-1,6-N-acetylglucosamine synthase-like glycosyltransferase
MMALLFFWLPVILLVYSYLIYPFILRILSHRRKPNSIVYNQNDDLPLVTILMAVHNEQEVLREKITSIISNSYPTDKIRILIGSDASTDNTNSILEEMSSSIDQLSCFCFGQRRGKALIINELAGKSAEGVLIITDANVVMHRDTVFQMVKHFKNSKIGLVDSNMMHKGLKMTGISVPENAYISREVRIKYNESLIWGTMMGPFGGCYAIRKKLYCDVPDLFLVDDFFINMKVITSGHKAIMEPGAIVTEDVSNSLRDEYRRKIRIAAGNFQNLNYFFRHLFSGIPGLSFSFISHKVLRWFGPFFLISVFASTLWLSREDVFYQYMLVLQVSVIIMPLIDYLLGKIKIHILILRFITHFISMNFALLVGFVKFLRGVKTNVWQPTRRNQ